MIEAILPAWVGVVELLGAPPEADLDPAEAAGFDRAVDSRRREFAAGRNCARQAMAKLGIPPAAILRGENREPLWPDGIIGSITHTKGYCAAAVARPAAARSLGIDAEPDGPLPRGVLGKVSTEAERAHLSSLPSDVHWDRLLFSAKESVYKSLWPLLQEWIGFTDATILFAPHTATFEATVTAPQPYALTGRYLIAAGFAMTSLVIPKSG